MIERLILVGAALVVSPVAASAQTGAALAPCAICHSTKPGENRLGPTLSHVVGRPKAAIAGFAYSPAMKAQKGVWSEAALDAFLANPRAAVPGTRMIYSGMPDAAQRAKLIAELKALK